jgi:hypothetical protein
MPLDRTLTESEVAKVWRRRKLGITLQRCADDLDVTLGRLDEAIWKWMKPKNEGERREQSSRADSRH